MGHVSHALIQLRDVVDRGKKPSNQSLINGNARKVNSKTHFFPSESTQIKRGGELNTLDIEWAHRESNFTYQ